MLTVQGASPLLQKTFTTSPTNERVIWDARLTATYTLLFWFSTPMIWLLPKHLQNHICDHFQFEHYISFSLTL